MHMYLCMRANDNSGKPVITEGIKMIDTKLMKILKNNELCTETV